MAEETEEKKKEEEGEEESNRGYESIIIRTRREMYESGLVARELRNLFTDFSDADTLDHLLLQTQQNIHFLLHQRQLLHSFNHELCEEIQLAKQKLEDAESGENQDEKISALELSVRRLQEQCQELEDVARDMEEQMLARKEQQAKYHLRIEELKRAETLQQRVHSELALYAQVTKILPDLDEDHLISGSIMDKKGRSVNTFELDPTNKSDFELCQALWDMSR